MKKRLSSSENQDTKVKICAITGGIGSGKSTVSKFYSELGIPVINTDNLAQKLMKTDEKLKLLLIKEFGNQIYLKNGDLDAELLSSIVFSGDNFGSDKLEKLNKTVHPAVIVEMMNEIENLIGLGNNLIFVESALVYEAGLDEGFDYIIVVDAPESKRIKRTSERLKLSEDDIRIRIREQISTDVKKNLADFVIENNGTIEEMLDSASFILDLIKLA